jgi:tetratricopeptide (TPR) repeat protein
MELASDKENWYAFKTKALFKTQQYQKCFEISKQALDTFDNLHYFNDVWFARRIALSKKHLGDSTDALNELFLVLRRKKGWYIQSEIAEIYKENNDFDKAFKYSIDAINNFGDLEYKVRLLVLIAEILEKKGEKELSFKHYMLSKLLRQQEKWKVPQTLDFALQTLGFSQIPLEQISNLKKELKNYWNTFKVQQTKPTTNNNQQQTGKIDKVLHNDEKGADGFIKYENNKSIYFRVNATDELIKILSVGLEVKFKVLPPKEEGKNERAVNVKQK